MAKLAAYPEPMTVADFLAFGKKRPDGEKWELLDGGLFLNASPVRHHQKLVANITIALGIALRAKPRDWEVIPGIGVRVSDFSSVEPDVMIRPRDEFQGNICDDIIVAFEVLSPSTRHNDLTWKRQNYPALPGLSHYVAVSAETMEVRVFARAAQWQEIVLTRPGDIIAFETLGISLSLAEIYEDLDGLPEPSGQ